MSSNILLKPVHIDSTHNRRNFHCSEEDLNDFIKNYAKQNHDNNTSKTYVILDNDVDKNIVAFYTLTYENIELQNIKNEVPSDVRRGVKDKIPCVLLAMIARDDSLSGKEFGKYMLREAIENTYKASKIAGVKGLFLTAINPTVAKKFYDKLGFLTKIDNEKRLYYIPIKTINKMMERIAINI